MLMGIVSGVYFPEYYWLLLPLFVSTALLYFIFQLFRNEQFKETQSFSLSILAFIFCFSFGYLNTWWQAEKHQAHHLVHVNEESIQAFEAELINGGKSTDKTFGYKASVSKVKIEGKWHNVIGKTMLYFEKDSISKTFRYGDVVLVNGKLSELKPPSNPYEFDYRSFLANDQVYHQQYVPQHNFLIVKRNTGNSLVTASFNTSDFLELQLEKYIGSPRSLAIAKALTLGIKNELDNELRDAYAAAGAMHVLAVSGLHVGIIFIIMTFLLKKWRNQKYGRIYFVVISLSFLWFYAFITGLSPSVLRAVTMFSFIILAQASRRRTNIYNTLALSAFVLLIYDPYLLFSVGFQLSYFAVLGIVFFQPKIYRLLQFENSLADKIWAITCVSIAAQLATAPLGLLYFHQFPTYFFLSNLVVIPAAFIILYSTLLLFVFSILPALAVIWGTLLDYFIQLVNYLVFGLNIFPASTIEGVFITPTEAWLLYLMLLCIAFLIIERKFYYTIATFILCVAFSSSIIARQIENYQVRKLTVFDTGYSTAVDFRVGFNQFLKVSEELAEDKSKLRFHIYPAYLQAGIADFDPDDFDPSKQNEIFKNWNGIDVTVWQNKKIALWDEKIGDTLIIKEPVPIDLLIISNNAVYKPQQIYQLFLPEKVIIDASNSDFIIQKLKANFEEENVDFYVVSEKGAFELKIQ